MIKPWRLAVDVVAASLALVEISSATPARAVTYDRADTCRGRPGMTVQQNRFGRVFVAHQDVYVCMKGRVSSRLLGGRWAPAVSSSGGGGILRASLAGPYVATVSEWFGDREYNHATASLQNAATGKRIFSYTYTPTYGAHTEPPVVSDLVACATKPLVVFIGGHPANPDQSIPADYEVRMSFGGRTRLLERNANIVNNSLKAHDKTVTWSSGALMHSASPPCATFVASIPLRRLTYDEAGR